MRWEERTTGKKSRLWALLSICFLLALLGTAILVTVAGTSQAQTQGGSKIALSNIYTPLLSVTDTEEGHLFRCSVVNVGANPLSVSVRAKDRSAIPYKEATFALEPGKGQALQLDVSDRGAFYCQFTIAGSPNAVRASASVAELVHPENENLPVLDTVAVAAE